MYELQHGDVERLAAFTGERTRERGDQLEFQLCPFCHGGAGRDQWTFAISRTNGAYKCLRAGCDAHGWFVQLARQVGYRIQDDEPVRAYRKPRQPSENVKLSERSIEFLAGRGISEKTARKYGLYSWERDGKDILVFPFWDQEHKEMLTAKVRDTGWHKGDKGAKEFFADENTRPILFGMDKCEGRDQLVITEGQLDSLSLAEAGIRNAVSVPNGASAFTWLRYCKEFVESFERVIVFGDQDAAGMSMVKTLSERIDKPIMAVRKVDYLGCKDANEVLCAFGPEELVTAVKCAEPYKTRHVIDLADVEQRDPDKLPKILTKIYELDRAIGGFVQGQIIVLTGRRGEGKSTFASSIIKDAVEQGKRVFVYSGELSEQHFKMWMDKQVAGRTRGSIGLNEYGDEILQLDNDTQELLRAWYRDKIYLFRDTDGEGRADCIDAAEEAVRGLGCELVVIDNLMTALSVNNQNDLYLAQSNFVGRLKRLCTVYNTCVLLLAHPRKMGKGEKDKDIDPDDVAGSGDITNRVDTVIAYQRGEDGRSGAISVIKNRLYGRLRLGKEKIPVQYDPVSMRVVGSTKMDAGEMMRDYLKDTETSNAYIDRYVFPGVTE